MYIYLCLYFFINFFLIKIKIFCGNVLENRKKILYKYYLIQKYIIQTIIADKTVMMLNRSFKYFLHVKLPISSC